MPRTRERSGSRGEMPAPSDLELETKAEPDGKNAAAGSAPSKSKRGPAAMPVPSDGQAASHVTGVVAAPVQGGIATVTRRPTPMRARHVKLQAAEGSGIVVARRPEGREEVMPTPSAGGTAGADAGAATTFVDNGGPVLQNIHVHLIFWGSAWAGSTTPSA